MARSECSNILEMLSWILVIKLFFNVGWKKDKRKKKKEREREEKKQD